jgi:FKBP-type peptidyl-prolyl cis-trans isomerase 2
MLSLMPFRANIEERTSGALSMLTIFVILLMVIGAVAAGYFFISSSPAAEQVYAVDADTVSVDYIGMFEDGKVFDTSRSDVANDNVTYPKSLSFQYRPTGYTPLEFTVGGGQMIKGFDEAVIGMRVGDEKTVTIPPEKGYGVSNSLQIEPRNITEDLPLIETMTNSEFNQRFFHDPIDKSSIDDPIWGWKVEVDVSGDDVTITHLPVMGSIVTPYNKWDSKVTYIDSSENEGEGIVRVEHLLKKSDENNIMASDSQGDFIITEVNHDDGTYTIDYNSEVTGKTLIFHIKIVDIKKPE